MQLQSELPLDIWEKLSYNLSDHPPTLCVLSKTSKQLKNLVQFVVGHYEAHLHITFPNDGCCHEEKTSAQKVQFEMVLNRKGRYSIGKAHCHSHFSCNTDNVATAIDDLLSVFANEIITLRFNHFPEKTDAFSVFNKHQLPKCDNICFNGSLPICNSVYDMFQSCPVLKKLAVTNPSKDTDFTDFWPLLKGSKLESLDLMDIECFHHSSIKQFKLPPNLNQLFFCPKKDAKCEAVEHLATVLYSGNWKRVYIHGDEVLHDLNAALYKPCKTIKEFSFSSKNFAVDYVAKFLKKCPNANSFNWYGLHSCVAPIVIARLLKDVSRSIVFGGCVACKGGQTVGNGGFMEVGNRIQMVLITNLLQRDDFRAVYESSLVDAVLFQVPSTSSAVMYIQKKDSLCGPNCIDIHEISQKAGIAL